MSNFEKVINKYREQSHSEADKGKHFERLMKAMLQTLPPYSDEFRTVWSWSEFPYRQSISLQDTGIDLVAQTIDDMETILREGLEGCHGCRTIPSFDEYKATVMAKYIIDTNTVIEYFKHRHGVPEHMSQVCHDDLYVSKVTIAKLLYRAMHSKSVDRQLHEARELQRDIMVLPISDTLDEYADIRHALTTNGITDEDFDIRIGAAARHYGLIAVTDNQKHFSLMPGVQTENWVIRTI